MSFRELGYDYVHSTKQGFQRQSSIFSYPSRAEISQVYMDNAAFVKSRYLAERKFEDNLKANEVYEKEMNKVLDLFATTNTAGAIEQTAESEYQANAKKVIERIQTATKAQAEFLSGSGKKSDKIKEALDDAKKLDKYVKELKKLIGELKDYNSTAVELAAQGRGTSKSAISKMTGTSMSDPTKGFYVMSINATGQTSLRNLAEKVKVLEQLNKELKTGATTVSRKAVSYTDHKTGEKRTRLASDLIAGIGYQITNMQGAIGEFLSFQLAENAIREGFLDDLAKSHGGKITVRGAGSDVNLNKNIGVQATSVGDIKIEIKHNEAIVSVIGVSAKAQFTGGKNKSSTTTFGTTTVDGLLARAEALHTQYDYLFLNGIAHNTNFAASGEGEGSRLRRYLAAKSMKYMLGGIGGSAMGGSRDEVYFLKYADTAYRVDEYFTNLAKESFTKLPIANVVGMKGLSLPKRENYAHAYMRSKLARKTLLSMKANVSKNL